MFWQWFFDKILLPGRVRVKILACIPARLSHTRFAGKVLAKDAGKFLGLYTCDDTGTPRQYAEFVKRQKAGN